MYYLIETEKQLKKLQDRQYSNVFIEIIPFSNTIHPVENQICALYIRPLDAFKGYIIPLTHSETLSLRIDQVERVLTNFKRIYVRDKKEFLHYLIFKALYDVTLHSPPYIQEYTQTHTWFYNKYPNKGDINRIIPISKHYEYCEKTYEDLKNRINEPINEFYNNKTTMVFNYIERSGIHIDREEFKSRFHNIDTDITYTQFNFKTLTTRPSNKFGGVNFAALNKKNGDRKCITPRNDLLFEIDISAYHPTLLGKLVKYDFGEKDIHKEFAKMYGVEYDKAKELTFKQLYGGIFKEYKELEFFKKVQRYKDDLWEEFQTQGGITCPISNYKFEESKLDEMNPQKLLNYLLQNLETSMNVCILWDIVRVMRGLKTKLILYTYDSFLFDVDREDKDEMKKVLGIFEKYKLQIKHNSGSTYEFR